MIKDCVCWLGEFIKLINKKYKKGDGNGFFGETQGI